MNVDLVPGATPVAKSPYRLAPLKMQEWSKQLQELQDKGVKDKILAASSETPKVENAPAEMLRDMDQQMERGQMMVPLVGSEMDEAHASRYLVHSGADKKYYNLGDI
ncbi:hypothetical protein Tco_1111063 [Tanacetum coccineum]|uniref:Reverse transcriptase domain-containing protein n=1 Tax=Tanacetum coccineum TaxID=301880 RepID=A0ABQ5IM18_9ASTR